MNGATATPAASCWRNVRRENEGVRRGMSLLLKKWEDIGKSDESRNGLRGVAGRTSFPPFMSTPPLSPAIFVDRDGTLMEEAHYCGDPALVKIIPGVPEALRALKEAGYRLVIITNQ